MQIYKTKGFNRWAIKEGLNDEQLLLAVNEIEKGLIDAILGGHVVKKRIALPGHGKRGSARTIVAYRAKERTFFVYGFAKNERSNVSKKELQALKLLADQLLNYSDDVLKVSTQSGELIKVNND